ncbi:shTK domain protein [Oesophagostomum dentatum]|uniref:ShTK domain protein n=1 Tax=Oesophagostomum dentatum TaxID=61180 RepID=A0A0B1T2R5_OESDE|nr:shTK domain protein [Oesophagostomum dentatum]
MTFLFLFFFIHTTNSQLLGCANGGSGACTSNRTCADPNTMTCITTSSGDICCQNTQIVVPTTSNTTGTAAVTCVDKVNPRTGVSDCSSLSYLCNDSRYYALMTLECPRTCNRCFGTSGSIATDIYIAPNTGISTAGVYNLLISRRDKAQQSS